MSFAFGNLLRVFFLLYYLIRVQNGMACVEDSLYKMLLNCEHIAKCLSIFEGMTICVTLVLWLAPYRRTKCREMFRTNIKRADTINRNLWWNASLHFHSREWNRQLDTLRSNYSKLTKIGSKLSEPLNGSNVTNSLKDTHLLLLLGPISWNLYASCNGFGCQSSSANSFKVIKYKQRAKLLPGNIFSYANFLCYVFVIIFRLIYLIISST